MIAATLTCVTGRGAEVQADLSTHLTPELGEIVHTDTEAWIKRLRAIPYDGRTMRERFTYRGDSLWWFTELYLARTRRLETALATLLALDAARVQHAPSRIAIETDDLVIRDATHAYGRAHSAGWTPIPSSTSSMLTIRQPMSGPGKVSTQCQPPPARSMSTPAMRATIVCRMC